MTKATAAALEELRPAIDDMIEQKLLEILGDPESGYALTGKIKGLVAKKVKKSQVHPAALVARELGLKW